MSMVQHPVAPELDELRAMVRAVLADEVPLEARTRREPERSATAAVWRRLGDLGITGLLIDPAAGGSGASMVEVAVVAEEFGRAVAPLPLATATIAVPSALEGSATPDGRRLLAGIASGELTAAVARPHHRDGVSATDTGSQLTVTGTVRGVLDGADVNRLVVAAALHHETVLVIVDVAAAGVTVDPAPSIDPSRRRATITLDDAPGVLASGPGWSPAALARSRTHLDAALAAESAGLAGRALEAAVDYATVRHQFGRPIGANQAIKHLLADRAVEAEVATAAARAACRAVADDAGDADALATAALATAGAAALAATETNIQVHGGIGFTWEHPAHLLLKRAKASSLLAGRPGAHLGRLAHHHGLLPDPGTGR